jgi:mannose/cellobiose epimerase-like protein (N-acyl-D-glucosamine 2-epimerase family)
LRPYSFPASQAAIRSPLSWLLNRALPFWGSIGLDEVRGGFHERLTLEGRPVLDVPRRLMVQCRQLYVFSHAALLEWYPAGRQLATRCAEHILTFYYRRDGEPGWIHSIAPDGSVANPTRDCYAHAFVLLGLAWFYKLTNSAETLRVIEETISFLDETSSLHGGYADALPAPDSFRRQNPHMHLFEAFLALFETTNDARYLARAAEIFGVFTTSFFQPDTGTLCEYLTPDLKPLPTLQGQICEPGHHYEWVWLLRRFQVLAGRDVGPFCSSLYEHADKFGWNAQGFIVDELNSSGRIIKGSARVWPCTESIKANLAEGEHGRQGCDEKAAGCLLQLTNDFLGQPFPGGWIDHRDENGKPAAHFVPASTLYHVFCSLAEAARLTAQNPVERSTYLALLWRIFD